MMLAAGDDNEKWAMMPIEGADYITSGADGFVHLTDSMFLSRSSGVGNVIYCVQDENGRVSNRLTMCLGKGPDFKVRLHGNGVTTASGLETMDMECTFGEGVVFPERLFKKKRDAAEDVSDMLWGWLPGTGMYDGAEGSQLYGGGVWLEEKDLEEWKRLGWVEDIDGIPTVHFYAIWQSEVQVSVCNPDGQELLSNELVNEVKYRIRIDDEWQMGAGTNRVLPGMQILLVNTDSGYGAYRMVKVWKDGAELAPVSDGLWVYDIPSTEGPQIVRLQLLVWAFSDRDFTICLHGNGGADRGGSYVRDIPTFYGKAVTLPANTFTRDGYVFQGWATSAGGEVVYADRAEVTVAGDMTLYAVWDNPALTLEAESADWAHGSLTLRCTDADTSGAAHKYSLFYRDNDTWAKIPVGGAGAADVAAGADGFAHLTDTGFASRQGGMGEVDYCVVDENGRVSGNVATRRRHGLPVGVGQYGNAEERGLAELRGAPALAREFGRIARQRGGFACREALAGAFATCRALDDALDEMAAKANPGDICLFYLNTHGGMDGTQGVFCMYDDDYFESRLVGKVERFYEKGAAFVAVLGTCHSEALVQRSFPNVGIIAAAGAESVSDDSFDKFLVRYGWDQGWAGSGDAVSFAELAGYAKARYETLYNGIAFADAEGGPTTTRRAALDNEPLLGRITAGKRGSHDATSAPGAVSGIAASQGTSGTQVEVSWDADGRADGYLVFGGRGESSICLGSISAGKNAIGAAFRLSKFPWLAESSADRPATFEVRAYNGAGVGTSDIAEGWIDSEASTGLPPDWLQCHPGIVEAAGGDVAVAAEMTAANGKMTVAECYALGIDPEDKEDDLRIVQFEMVDGKPVIGLNHTEDGSATSFLPDVGTLGATALGAGAEWDDVTDIADPGAAGYRFFRAKVALPE
jgi:uncharacterized repeat protein (TIGR02543 family)